MSKGDTTIRIDMEVAGASSAKMTAKDVYQSIESASRKATSTEEAEMKKRAKAAKDLAKFKEKTLKQNQAQEYRDWQRNEQKKIDSVASLQAQRSREAIARFRAEEQEKKRISRETAAETKRIAREQERDSKRRMREEARDAKALANQKGMMGGLLGRGLWAGAMGIAGYAGVAGVASAASSIAGSEKNSEERRSQLEKDITPVVSLGDNVNKMGAIRTEVIGLAAAMGLSNKEIAAFMESLESLSNTMTPEVLAQLKKESLELTDLTGGDLQTNMRMLAKTNEIYGDSFENLNHAQNKLLKTQEDADVSMEEMAYRMPELMATAKQLGISFDEVAAGIISTTIALGRPEGAFTGFRNVLAAMEEAEKKGIKLTGTFAERLDQLKVAADAGKVSLLELFGRDPLAAGGALLERSETVRENVAMLEGMDPAMDAVADKRWIKYKDPRFAAVRQRDLDMSLLENAPNISADLGIENPMTDIMKRWRAGKIAGAAVSDGMFGVQTIMGLAAALGNDKAVAAGNSIRLRYTPEDSLFRGDIENDLLKYKFDDFEKKKEEDLSALGYDHTASAALGGVFGLDWDSPERKAIKSRNFNYDQAKKELPSLEKTIGIASAIDESNKLLRENNKNQLETNRLLSNMQPSGNGLKPGGGKANAEETL